MACISNCAQTVAAVEVGFHDLESDFVHAGPAQQNLGADVCAFPPNIEQSLPSRCATLSSFVPMPPPRLNSRTEMLDFPHELLMRRGERCAAALYSRSAVAVPTDTLAPSQADQ